MSHRALSCEKGLLYCHQRLELLRAQRLTQASLRGWHRHFVPPEGGGYWRQTYLGTTEAGGRRGQRAVRSFSMAPGQRTTRRAGNVDTVAQTEGDEIGQRANG